MLELSNKDSQHTKILLRKKKYSLSIIILMLDTKKIKIKNKSQYTNAPISNHQQSWNRQKHKKSY